MPGDAVYRGSSGRAGVGAGALNGPESHALLGRPGSLSESGGGSLQIAGLGGGGHAVRHSTTGVSMLRSFAPLVAVLFAAGGMLLLGAVWLSAHAHVGGAGDEQLAITIQQLRHNQEGMMALLNRLAADKASGGDSNGDSSDSGGAGAGGEPLPAPFAALPLLTRLHNTLLRGSHDYEAHRDVVRQTLDALVHREPAAAAAEVEARLAASPPAEERQPRVTAALFALHLYKLLLSSGKLIPCREDTTLVAGDTALAPPGDAARHGAGAGVGGRRAGSGGGGAGGSAAHPRYYFATNLRDNSVSMPHYTLHLLQTLLRLPRDAAFVSAYESNSDDGAHGWVDVLQLALNAIGTPCHLVARGGVVRLARSSRIQHLARVRNMALRPLYAHYAALRAASSSSSGGGGAGPNNATAAGGAGRRRRAARRAQARRLQASSSAAWSNAAGGALSAAEVAALEQALHAHRRGRSSRDSSGSESTSDSGDSGGGGGDAEQRGVLPWSPDFIVFVNDAYFCWSMVLRLLNYRADITCGLDFWQNQDATVELPAALRAKSHRPKPHIPAQYRLEAPIPDPLSPDQTNPIVFYDVWVARDLSGSKFWWTYPFVHDRDTQQAATKGLPLRASCCWNGLSVLRAAPFEAGLRVRTPLPDECQGSECSMVCEDFARLGYDNVVVDAGVQMTYDWHLAREMMALGVEGIGQSTWAQAKAAGIAGRSRRPDYKNSECCSLQPGAQWVVFTQDCFRQDVLATNWTARALEQQQQRQRH